LELVDGGVLQRLDDCRIVARLDAELRELDTAGLLVAFLLDPLQFTAQARDIGTIGTNAAWLTCLDHGNIAGSGDLDGTESSCRIGAEIDIYSWLCQIGILDRRMSVDDAIAGGLPGELRRTRPQQNQSRWSASCSPESTSASRKNQM
jgi:hypothetical protein